ncbi:hypothetical protein OUZ56_010308 [Daphnia magna]|uniref:Paraneoplastic antigen Ma-like C-terminal domain-containing protein n=1 Tax=Daphnia magna TaxID=35525 RepID=A0ABR0AI60_9CRUS|nr:hypothetical protein OUZ56_010308 [Daphnia magna]
MSETPEEKLGKTVLNTLSPKRFKRTPKVKETKPEEAENSESEDYQTGSSETEYETEEELPGKDEQPTDDTRWENLKGKALRRTPPPTERLYPQLSEVEEKEIEKSESEEDLPEIDEEDKDREELKKPKRKARKVHIKGQPPTRWSSRNKHKAQVHQEEESKQTQKTTESNETEGREEKNSSTEEENESENPSDSENEEKVNENLASLEEEDEKPVRRPGKEKSAKEKEIKTERKRPIAPSYHKQLDQSIQTGKKPLVGETPRMDYQSHYDHMYRCMKAGGASKEEAHMGAKAAAKQIVKSMNEIKEEQKEKTSEKSCPIDTSQSYYLSQKLLLNQQQQTVSLLAQVPAFNGLGSTKFEDWIKHFDAVMNTSEFEEGRKIKLLCSKLFGSATDCVTTFQLRYPKEAQEFSKIKQCLQDRYHGGDSRKIYLTEYNNCIRNPGESIRDYACRIQKLFSFAYPTREGKLVDLEMREQLIIHKFLGGLKNNLRERMSFKEFKNLDSLIKATENCAAVLNEAKLERRNVEFINAVASNSNASSSSEIKGKLAELEVTLKNNQQLMSELMLQNQETAKLLNKVVQTQTQTNFRSQTGFHLQPAFQAQAGFPTRSMPQSQLTQNCNSQFEQNPQRFQQQNKEGQFGQKQPSQSDRNNQTGWNQPGPKYCAY